MKKKILGLGIIAVLIVMLFSLTGCGKEEKINNEYQEYIDAIRNAKASAYYGEHTLGELFDNALDSSSWDRYTKEVAGGTKKILISVKGTNKFENDKEVEVVYQVDKETLEYKYYKMFVNNETDGGLATLLKKSADDLDSK